MKFITIADTHGLHQQLTLPQGDVLIHAGDVSKMGELHEIVAFLDWFSNLDFEHKIFIAGNHDFYFEDATAQQLQAILPANVHYLCNSSITINGITIWGSPISPFFFNWAFNVQRGEAIAKYWNTIPTKVDVVVTHGPVLGYLDKTIHRENVGCANLLDTLHKIQPKYHICGHIHEGYGQTNNEYCTFINASVVNVNYKVCNAPITFKL
jgi:Icc-related predicted phosphoesterase